MRGEDGNARLPDSAQRQDDARYVLFRVQRIVHTEEDLPDRAVIRPG
jgi:hypothetical protein